MTDACHHQMAMGWERNTHELEADSREFQGLGGISQIDCGIHGKKKLEVGTHQHSEYQFYEFIGWKEPRFEVNWDT